MSTRGVVQQEGRIQQGRDADRVCCAKQAKSGRAGGVPLSTVEAQKLLFPWRSSACLYPSTQTQIHRPNLRQGFVAPTSAQCPPFRGEAGGEWEVIRDATVATLG